MRVLFVSDTHLGFDLPTRRGTSHSLAKLLADSSGTAQTAISRHLQALRGETAVAPAAQEAVA